MLWLRVILPASLLVLGLLLSVDGMAQERAVQKRGTGPDQYYPWVSSRDSIVRGVNHMAFGPNYSGDVFVVEFELSASQYVSINMYSLSGHNVVSKSFKVKGRQLHTERILMGNLATGFYVLIIETDTERLVRKILRP